MADRPNEVLGQGDFPFEDLYALYAPELFRYTSRRLGRETAEDITSQVFVEAKQGWHRFDPEKGSTKTWLYKIATNQIGNHLRREKRTFDLWTRSVVDPVAEDPGSITESRLIAEEQWALVAAALRDFKQVDRDIVLLHCWADMPLDQVAETLGIPEGTVRSKLARARKKLRKQLGDVLDREVDE